MQLVLITALGVGSATIIGALIGFLIKRIPHRFNDAVLGFAAVTGEDARLLAKRFARYGAPIEPNGAHSAIYEEKYKTYKALRQMYMQHR